MRHTGVTGIGCLSISPFVMLFRQPWPLPRLHSRYFHNFLFPLLRLNCRLIYQQGVPLCNHVPRQSVFIHVPTRRVIIARCRRAINSATSFFPLIDPCSRFSHHWVQVGDGRREDNELISIKSVKRLTLTDLSNVNFSFLASYRKCQQNIQNIV